MSIHEDFQTPMKDKKILLYGEPKTGKSTFVTRINGIEKNEINEPIEIFPVIYVHNIKPGNTDEFDIILKFNQNDVLFEKY